MIPSILNTVVQQEVVNTCSFAPLSNSFANAINCNYYISPNIIGLFFICGPATIFRFVVSVYVLSIQAIIFGWGSSHILQKISKGIDPSFTYFYSTATIYKIFRMIWIAAPTFHTSPCLVLLGSAICKFTVCSCGESSYISHAFNFSQFQGKEKGAVLKELVPFYL